MELTTKDTQSTVSVADSIFSADYNESLVHQTIVAYMNRSRSGNSAQKTRAEVRGGGKKPFSQKGTGRARAGTIRSPLWRTGGVIFAAKKRDYAQKVNRKMYQGALRSIFAELNRRGLLMVLSNFQCQTPKTKAFISQMDAFGIKNALIIVNELGENEYLASRNLYHFDVRDVQSIDPVSLIRYENVLITVEALKSLEEHLL